jgi:3-hydroxyisobutyrate dehydrogenase-like beta-hydroxyacid dehydrogenase
MEKRIGVLGLGLMGSALARELTRGGHNVVAWSRTKSPKGSDIEVSATVAELVARSDIILSVLRDYEATTAVIEAGDALDLAGKVFCQMASGSQTDANELGALVGMKGGRYLDAGMKLGPSDFGTERGYIVFSGDRDAFDAMQPIHSHLGGRQVYLGERMDLAKGFEIATFVRNYPWFFGFFQSVAVAKRIGLDLEQFIELLMEVTPIRAIERSIPQIVRGEFSLAENASIDVHRAALGHALAGAAALGVDTSLLEAIDAYMHAAVAQGLGNRDIAACYAAVAREN